MRGLSSLAMTVCVIAVLIAVDYTSAKTSDLIISRDQAIGELPCFKCHSFQKFSHQPEKGIFSHRLHIDTGFHCNQCHDFQGHKHIGINRDACTTCHNKELVYKVTGMGIVKFSHKLHANKFSCDKCHPNLFTMNKTQGKITMDAMNQGKLCGACHNGKIAISVTECDKCHK